MLRVALICLGVIASTVTSDAQRVRDRIANDELAVVDGPDPIMDAAIAQGRATLPQFLILASSPSRSMSNFTIKVPVPTNNGDEFFWIKDFQLKNGRYSGRINNTPRWATHLKDGDVITFAENEIVDWMYVHNGRMKGNFTFCARMKREPKKEARAAIKQFKADCRL